MVPLVEPVARRLCVLALPAFLRSFPQDHTRGGIVTYAKTSIPWRDVASDRFWLCLAFVSLMPPRRFTPSKWRVLDLDEITTSRKSTMFLARLHLGGTCHARRFPTFRCHGSWLCARQRLVAVCGRRMEWAFSLILYLCPIPHAAFAARVDYDAREFLPPPRACIRSECPARCNRKHD